MTESDGYVPDSIIAHLISLEVLQILFQMENPCILIMVMIQYGPGPNFNPRAIEGIIMKGGDWNAPVGVK